MNPHEREAAMDQLAEEISKKSCVLFLGPGCSEARKLRAEAGVSSTPKAVACALAARLQDTAEWRSRIDSICAECAECAHCLLPEVATQYEARYGRDSLLDFVRELLRNGETRKFHRELWNLEFSAIYTINYDQMVEKSLEGSDRIVPVTSDKVFATVSRVISEGKRIPYYKLHGCISQDDVIITIEDQLRLRLAKDHSELWRELRRDIRDKTFLFIGYALGDTDLLEVIYSVDQPRLDQSRPLRPSYAVIDEPIPFQARHWLQKFNIRTFPGPTDVFFADLTDRYRRLWAAQLLPTTALKARRPTLWAPFEKLLNDQHFGGMVLYGQDYASEDEGPIIRELSTIPLQMHKACTEEQERGKRILPILLRISQLGADVYVDEWRFVKLLEEVAKQIDAGLLQAGASPLKLVDKLDTYRQDTWRSEADSRVQEYWYDRLGETAYADVVENPTPEQQKVNRQIRDRFLTGRASDWFFTMLQSLQDEGFRLMIFITDFELIEVDLLWLALMTERFIRKWEEFGNAGLVIARRATDSIHMDSRHSGYNWDRLPQFSIRDTERGA
jgi:hypothetical protein